MQEPTYETIRSDAPRYGRVPRQLLRDPELSDRAVRLYALLDDYADQEGRAFPSRSTLAAAMGCSVDSIDRAVRDLEQAGWIGRTQRRKSDRSFASTIYTLRWEGGSRTAAATPSRTTAATPSRTGADTLAAPVRTEGEPREGEPEEEEHMLTADAASEPVDVPVIDRSTGEAVVLDRFEEFWRCCPRKVGKRAAEKAYRSAVKRLDGKAHPDPQSFLIDSMALVALDPNLPEKKFLPHPSTWLNRDGWDDEPYPPRDRRRVQLVDDARPTEPTSMTGAEFFGGAGRG